MPKKKPAKTVKQKTEIVCVLDRSGSMNVMCNEAIGGFNSFLETQQKLPGIAKLTLCLFDHEYMLMHEGEDIKKVKPLDHRTYSPRGTTALIDAIGRTVDSVTERLKKTPKNRRADKVVMAILTDGYENASQDYTNDKVREMLEKQREENGWEIVYLAANQDAFGVARDLGLSGNGAVAINFAGTAKGGGSSMRAMSNVMARSRMTEGSAGYCSTSGVDADSIANDASWDANQYISQTDDQDDNEQDKD